MKIAAKPAVSSSEAGTSASSSRLRTLLTARQLPGLELAHEVLRVVLGAQLVRGDVRFCAGVSVSTGTPDS